MALHVGDTAPPGTAWAFNKDIKCVLKQDRDRDDDYARVISWSSIMEELIIDLPEKSISRLEEVQPESLASSCGITNKVREKTQNIKHKQGEREKHKT